MRVIGGARTGFTVAVGAGLVLCTAFAIAGRVSLAARPGAADSTLASPRVGAIMVRAAVAHDESAPLAALWRQARAAGTRTQSTGLPENRGVSPPDPDGDDIGAAPGAGGHDAAPGGTGVEQRTQGNRPALPVLAAFDGLGDGFTGPQGTHRFGNPSDNALAVGPDHIVQIVNGGMAVFTKKGARFDTTGKVLYGPMSSNAIFTGFGGPCEMRNSGDAVVRYDQLANRWLYVLPVFQRGSTPPVAWSEESRPGQAGQPGTPGPNGLINTPAPPPPPPPPARGAGGGRGRGEPPPMGQPVPPQSPYSMCYAVSVTSDPLGPYYRYEFLRPLFPDYPRPAIWTDGYYLPTSTSDNFIQKHACVADRTRMLQGLPATEQCLLIDGVNFLNMADIDGQNLPPAGAPELVMAAGGSQLHQLFEDDGIYYWQFHVDWDDPAKTGLRGPVKIAVSPYHYLCNGQLTNCVPQPDTNRRLDAQGDKLMQRLVYRNVNGHESILAVHSVNTAAGGGGVRWYEFRLSANRDPVLFQQGTYAPDGLYRWLPSGGIDRAGNIGIGYSFGGASQYPGQRFAARLASDPPGVLPFHESILVEGGASQKNQMRWEDYTTTAMDPVDDCTFWYVGDYLKAGSAGYSSHVGSFRVPGCRQGTVAGSAFFDTNHDGVRDGGELGLPGRAIRYTGGSHGALVTDSRGAFTVSLPADEAYGTGNYSFTMASPLGSSWIDTWPHDTVPGVRREGRGFAIHLADRDFVTSAAFGLVCVVPAHGARAAAFWLTPAGATVMAQRDSNWTRLFDSIYISDPAGSRVRVPRGPAGYDTLRAWLPGAIAGTTAQRQSAAIAVAGLNVVSGFIDGDATIEDPVHHDWPEIHALLGRASVALATNDPAAVAYAALVDRLVHNAASITPKRSTGCAVAGPKAK